MFPEWINEKMAEAADPTEGYFVESARQAELTLSLGQVACSFDHSELEVCPGEGCGPCRAGYTPTCPECGASV